MVYEDGLSPPLRARDRRASGKGVTGSVGPMRGSRHRAPGCSASSAVVRFLTVGGLATVVSFVGFNALVLHGLVLGRAPLADQPVLAFVLVNTVAGVLAYVGMRLWAFRDRRVSDRRPGWSGSSRSAH